MDKVNRFFEMAKEQALAGDEKRNFLLGAVGIRSDGALVSSKNGAVYSISDDEYKTLPTAHAEGRLCRKLGKNGIVYVVRIAKKDGALVMARPCPICASLMKAREVQKIYYSINSFQYGVFFPVEDKDAVYDL